MYFGSPKRLILVTGTSLTAALAVAWFGLRTESAPADTNFQVQPVAASAPAPVPPETVGILTARSSLPANSAVTADLIGRVEVAPDQVSDGLLQDTPENRAALAGLTLGRAVPMGTAFVAADLTAPPPAEPEPVAAPLAASPAMALNPGMRAISIPVTAETAVAGLISGGDRVDILMSYDTRDSQRAVRTILRNVRVVARDRVTDTALASAGVPRIITLELDPEGAKVLTLAMQTGELLLVLSPPGGGPDPIIVADEPMLSTDILGAAPPAPAAPRAPVQVFRGSGARAAAPALLSGTSPDPASP